MGLQEIALLSLLEVEDPDRSHAVAAHEQVLVDRQDAAQRRFVPRELLHQVPLLVLHLVEQHLRVWKRFTTAFRSKTVIYRQRGRFEFSKLCRSSLAGRF